MKTLVAVLFLGIAVFSCDSNNIQPVNRASVSETSSHTQKADTMTTFEVHKTEEEWRKILSAEEYRILRNEGTELPYWNKYDGNKEEGIYYCRACGQPLYSSKHKYDSGTGWPSFWQPVKPSAVAEREDKGWFGTRTEIICARCGSHLGHVFTDGPEPTGLRYCMNSAALDFVAMDLSKVEVENLPVRD